MMPDLTPEERKKELSEAFAAGLELFQSKEAERKAKEEAQNPPKENNDDDTGGKKSWAERILGF